jgi:hypothetical protein
VYEMEADGPIAVGKSPGSGAEGDETAAAAGNRTAVSCEDEESLEPKAGAQVASEVSPTSVEDMQAPTPSAYEPMDAAEHAAVSVETAVDMGPGGAS